MLLYLLFPAILWCLSCQLLVRARGQRGFDIFFWHFVLIGLEGLAALLLVNYFQVPSGNRLVLYIVGGHTLLLVAHSLQAMLATKLRARTPETARVTR